MQFYYCFNDVTVGSQYHQAQLGFLTNKLRPLNHKETHIDYGMHMRIIWFKSGRPFVICNKFWCT
jgi:kynurenine formamidase